MEAPEISIIVPVYNVKKYLEKSLNSIQNQSFKNWECIVVDDGSTDGSGEICENFGKRDSRFRVFHKENGGVSSARNYGLKEASGQYITFADPDDWVEENFLSTLYELITRTGADVAQCGFYQEFTTYQKKKTIIEEERLLGFEDAIEGLLHKNVLPSYLWNKIYKKEIATKKFPEGKNYEDAFTIPEWFKNVRKVALSPTLIYHYRMRGKSITKIGVAKNHRNYVEACCHIADTVHSLVPDRFGMTEKNAYFVKIAIDGAKTIARREKDKTKKEETIEWISSKLKEIEIPGIKTLGFKLWMRGNLLARYPLFFGRLMRGLHKIDFYSIHRTNHYFE